MDIIINADDFGLTDGVSKSIIELLEKDVISNTTILIHVDGAFGRCKLLRDAGLAGHAGVHLNTTPENYHNKPLSRPQEIPSLVDEKGVFYMLKYTNNVNPDEIELEWERQIIRTAEALGETPSHMDSHQGWHRVPELMPIYFKLATKYNIPVRGGVYLNQVDGSEFGVKSTALCLNAWSGKNNDLDNLKQSILDKRDKMQTGVLEITTHPGFCDDELIKSSSWNTVRENDHKVLMELAEEGWLQKQGFNLIHFSDLH